jgi:magnesium transporter
MITHYHSTARSRALTVIDGPKAGSWCHVVEPSSEELDEIAKLFSLDRDVLSDAVDVYEAPRVEAEENTIYVFTRYCRPDDPDIPTEPMLIIYMQSNLITIMRSNDNTLDRIINGHLKVLTTQKTKTFLHILEQINHSYRTQLTQIAKQIFRFRSLMRGSDVSNIDILKFIELEEDLNEFISALQPQALVLSALESGKHMKLYEDDQELFDDLSLDTNELIELCKSRLRTVVNIRQAYDVIATNNLNKIFKRLTSIGIFLSIPMIMVGAWGMNVALPFAHNPNAFWIIAVFTALLTYGTMTYFKKRNWL